MQIRLYVRECIRFQWADLIQRKQLKDTLHRPPNGLKATSHAMKQMLSNRRSLIERLSLDHNLKDQTL